MNEQKRIEIEADRILRLFSNSGAQIVQPAVLQRADTLLDLYGEDIRARAYVTSDPFNGEMMLRPDFTVPIVKTHMTGVTGMTLLVMRIVERCFGVRKKIQNEQANIYRWGTRFLTAQM